MADKINVWNRAEEVTVSPVLPPYTRVVLNADEDIWYEAPASVKGGVVSAAVQYAASGSDKTPPDEGVGDWAEDITTWINGRCLWGRPTSILAEQPKKGPAVDVRVQYAKSTSASVPPAPESPEWVDADRFSPSGGVYVWGRALYTLTSGEVVLGDPFVADQACFYHSMEESAWFTPGSDHYLELRAEYYLSSSPVALENGNWSEVKIEHRSGWYYFVRSRTWEYRPASDEVVPGSGGVRIVYRSPVAAASMTTEIGEPFFIVDHDKDEGQKMVYDVCTEYYLSSSPKVQKDGDWSEEYPEYHRGGYYWLRCKMFSHQKINNTGDPKEDWDDAPDEYTYPVAAPLIQSEASRLAGEEAHVSIATQCVTSASTTAPPEADDPDWVRPMQWAGRPYVWGRVLAFFAIQTPKGRTVDVEVQYAASNSDLVPPPPTDDQWRYPGVTLTAERPWPWGRVTAILSTGERVAGTPWLADQHGWSPNMDYQLRTNYYLSTSRSELKGGSWSVSKPAYQNGRFYFVKSTIWRTYQQADGSYQTHKTYESPVAATLMVQEIGDPYLIVGVNEGPVLGDFFDEYYLSSSPVEPRYGQWVPERDGVPPYRKGFYYWVRQLVSTANGEIHTEPVLAPTLTSVGSVLTLECPWATQEMADNILARIKGYSYQPLSARNTLLDPAAELGDTIAVDGIEAVIAAATVNYETVLTVDASAPAEEEIDHEYPMTQLSNREIQREISKKAWSTLSVAREEIFMEVGRAINAETVLSSRLSITAGQISAKVSKEDLISEINMTEEKISLTTSQFELVSDQLKIQNDEIQTISPSYTATFNSGGLTFFHGGEQVGSIYGSNTAYRYDNYVGTGYKALDIEVAGKALIFSTGQRYHYAYNNGLNPWDNLAKHYFSDDVYMRCDLKVGDLNYGAKIECGSVVVVGTDSVKQRVIDTDYGQVGLSAMESTYPVFSDLGSGEIGEDGTVCIFLDPDFSETVELTHAYHVNLTQTSPGRIDWTEKRGGYFIVHGEAGTAFDWILYARQKGQLGSRLEQKKISVDRPNLSKDMFDDMIDSYPGEREEEGLYLQMEVYLDEYEKEVNPER